MSVDYVNTKPNWVKQDEVIPTVLGWENKNTGEILVSLTSVGGAANPQPSKYMEIHGIEKTITPGIEKTITPVVTTLNMSQKTMSLNETENKDISVTVTPESSTQSVIWETTNEGNVIIGDTGLNCTVIGIIAGTSTITAKWSDDNSIIATCVVTVKSAV